MTPAGQRWTRSITKPGWYWMKDSQEVEICRITPLADGDCRIECVGHVYPVCVNDDVMFLGPLTINEATE